MTTGRTASTPHGQDSGSTSATIPEAAKPLTVTSNVSPETSGQDIPAGLLVSVGERGGYCVPRQLDGHPRRR